MKLVVSSLAVVLGSTVAHADPAPEGQRSYASATVGLATPVGEAGVEFTWLARPQFELGLGVGLSNTIFSTKEGGESTPPNAQFAVMPRYRLPIPRGAVTLGVGLSGGRYTVASSPFSSSLYDATTMAMWANAELGVELFAHGFTFGTYAGYGRVIAHGDVVDPRNQKLMNLPDNQLPYFGIRVGHTL